MRLTRRDVIRVARRSSGTACAHTDAKHSGCDREGASGERVRCDHKAPYRMEAVIFFPFLVSFVCVWLFCVAAELRFVLLFFRVSRAAFLPFPVRLGSVRFG